jgi:hypothetical protein
MLNLIGISDWNGGKYVLPEEPADAEQPRIPANGEDWLPRFNKGAQHQYNAQYLRYARAVVLANEKDTFKLEDDVSKDRPALDHALTLSPACLCCHVRT